jgi:hypothetical protein
MKRIFAGALCAVALAGLSSTASAVPIYFDFTGTVTTALGPMSGLEGTAVSGGFTIETNGLTRFEDPDPYQGNLAFHDNDGSRTYTFLNFGTQSVTFPVYPQSNAGSIVFHDEQCFYNTCHPGLELDTFALYADSSDSGFGLNVPPDFVGTFHESTMGVIVQGDNDFIDRTTAAPIDIATQTLLPTQAMYGYYGDFLFTCRAQTLCSRDDNSFAFTIESVTRGVGPRAVPEPGTLGLLAAALAGMFFALRRRDLLQG